MDIFDIRNVLRSQSIYDTPMRVVYYARVSTDKEEQANSLENQVEYYEEFIRKIPAWTFVGGYVDEGLSGISTKKRENFNRMVEDAYAGNFDFIITKEISRFARNTLDSIKYTRDLLNHGVAVLFQTDNINTLDEDAELRLAIMSSIAQDELRKLSSRIKFGHHQAIKNGVVIGNSRIMGYKKDHKKLVIDEEQAPFVRELFELYSTGQYSMKQIEKIFWNKGYRNNNGNMIAHSTMANIISNPKYKGYYVGNKVKIIDMFTKKQKFLPPEEWVMFKDESGKIVPAIVSEDIWNKANEVLRKRSDDVKGRKGICNHENLFTGKLFCSHCGKPYYRKAVKEKDGGVNSKWECSGKIKNGKDSCDSFIIYESDLTPLIFEAFKESSLFSQNIIDSYEEIFKTLNVNEDTVKLESKYKSTIESAKKKKAKLLELVTNDSITNDDFKEMTAKCNDDIKDAQTKLLEISESKDSRDDFHHHMESIKRTLLDAQSSAKNGTLTREFVNSFIDKIMVTPLSKDTMRLDIKIFTGETTEKYLEKLRNCNKELICAGIQEGCTGHTFKKMIESYENSLK